LDRGLFGLAQTAVGPAVLVGGGCGQHAGPAAGRGIQIGPRLCEVHQRAALGVHIQTVAGDGHIAQHGVGAVVGAHVLELQLHRARQGGGRRGGRHLRSGGGQRVDERCVGVVTGKIGHGAVQRADLDLCADRGGHTVQLHLSGEREIAAGIAHGAHGAAGLGDGGLAAGEHLAQKGTGGLGGLRCRDFGEGGRVSAAGQGDGHIASADAVLHDLARGGGQDAERAALIVGPVQRPVAQHAHVLKGPVERGVAPGDAQRLFHGQRHRRQLLIHRGVRRQSGGAQADRQHKAQREREASSLHIHCNISFSDFTAERSGRLVPPLQRE